MWVESRAWLGFADYSEIPLKITVTWLHQDLCFVFLFVFKQWLCYIIRDLITIITI